MTKVVHIRNKHDVCIMRPGKWGNPFLIGVDGTREEVIKKYQDWLTTSPDAEHLRKSLPMLQGLTLGCCCTPLPCHGDVLVKLINDLD